LPAVKDEDTWDDSETVAATRLVIFGEMDFIVVGCLIKKRERERRSDNANHRGQKKPAEIRFRGSQNQAKPTSIHQAVELSYLC
jgi:hypothetical protein